eukprot:TRINITY_DN551_c0_g2_i1.p1 TRINITY_DN551_c0_g2~~TRINITY_DN551_c0_g2_i1.p1  ORF type:complete len:346 (-),score=40.95 TRINITY_DN551_c0_g2_i1:1218-2255(-)
MVYKAMNVADPCHEKVGERELLWEEDGFSMYVQQQKRNVFNLWVRGDLNLTPKQTFRVFTNPDNSKVIRDVESILFRKVLSCDDEVKVVEVKQRAHWRILIFGGVMVSHMIVTENRKRGKINFRLAQPGLMKQWEGEWRLEDNGKHGTQISLELVVAPSFIPPFLSGLLRALTAGSTRRFIQDLQRVDEIFSQGERALDEILGNDTGREEWNESNESSTSSTPDLKSYEIDFGDELIEGEFIEVESRRKIFPLWKCLKPRFSDNSQPNNKSSKQKRSKKARKMSKNEKRDEKRRVKLERKRCSQEKRKAKKEEKAERQIAKLERKKAGSQKDTIITNASSLTAIV